MPRGAEVEGKRNRSLRLTEANYYTWNGKTGQHRKYAECPVVSHNGKENEKVCKYINVCITESLCCTEAINTTL